MHKPSPITDAEYIFKQVVLTNNYLNTGRVGISALSTSVDSKKATGFLPAWDKVE